MQGLEQLKAERREAQNLVDKANAPIFGVDVEGNINEWNEKAEEITGFKKAEVLGKHLVKQFITPEYRQSVTQVVEDALCQRHQASSYEFPLYTKHGMRLDIMLNATTRRDDSGKVVGVIGVGHDMTHARKVSG